MSGPVDLERLVLGYMPHGDERSYRIAVDALASGRPMWPRSEFSPGHFTASGFVSDVAGTAVLLIHHTKLGRWLQPGGHIEPGDATVEAAIRREVAEETSLVGLERLGEGLLHIDAHPIPAHGAEPAHVHIDLTMGFRAVDDRIGSLEEVIDARWVSFDELDAVDSDGAVHRGAAALGGLLGGTGR